jgi:hypothetical protein
VIGLYQEPANKNEVRRWKLEEDQIVEVPIVRHPTLIRSCSIRRTYPREIACKF